MSSRMSLFLKEKKKKDILEDVNISIYWNKTFSFVPIIEKCIVFVPSVCLTLSLTPLGSLGTQHPPQGPGKALHQGHREALPHIAPQGQGACLPGTHPPPQ